jgi:DNA-binding GntR family transcriptional regulator
MSTIGISETWQHGHQDILDALKRGDGVEAARIARREIESGLSAITRAVLSHPAIADTNIPPMVRSPAEALVE